MYIRGSMLLAVFFLLPQPLVTSLAMAGDAVDTGAKDQTVAIAVHSDFSRICNNGQQEGASDCPVNMTKNDIGNSAGQWGCTLDNLTGLMWEVKQEGGPRNKEHTYGWGSNNMGSCSGLSSSCSTDSYVDMVNKKALCGYRDWRLPSRRELLSLVRHHGQTGPVIDIEYFPHTQRSFYWTRDLYESNPSFAWSIDFDNGKSAAGNFHYSYLVRLVHGQWADIVSQTQ